MPRNVRNFWVGHQGERPMTPTLLEPWTTIIAHLAELLRQGKLTYAEYLDAEIFWLNLMWKSL